MKINKKIVIKEIQLNRDKLKKLNVIRIGLFGSVLKGGNAKKSDVDILVKFSKNTFDNYAGLIILLEKIFRKKVDLITEPSLRPELAYVKREAKYVRL